MRAQITSIAIGTTPNSLSRKILPITPYGSRFCPTFTISKTRNSISLRILAIPEKKNQNMNIPSLIRLTPYPRLPRLPV